MRRSSSGGDGDAILRTIATNREMASYREVAEHFNRSLSCIYFRVARTGKAEAVQRLFQIRRRKMGRIVYTGRLMSKRRLNLLMIARNIREQGGASLAEVGEFLGGVTRERARQLLSAHGGPARRGSPLMDVVRLLSIVRQDSTVTSWHCLLRRVGVSPSQDNLHRVRDCFRALGYRASAERLFRFRLSSAKRKDLESKKKQVVDDYLALQEKIGHVPSSKEVNALYSSLHRRIYRYFENLSDMREKAGIPQEFRELRGRRRRMARKRR